jgi:hypothetical protein
LPPVLDCRVEQRQPSVRAISPPRGHVQYALPLNGAVPRK